jgi:hypothetical protein
MGDKFNLNLHFKINYVFSTYLGFWVVEIIPKVLEGARATHEGGSMRIVKPPKLTTGVAKTTPYRQSISLTYGMVMNVLNWYLIYL